VEKCETKIKMSQMSQNEPKPAHFEKPKRIQMSQMSQNEPQPAHFGSLKKNEKKNEKKNDISKNEIFHCLYCNKEFTTKANKRRHELHRCTKTDELALKNELNQKTELVKLLLEEKYEAILEEKEKCIDALKHKYSNVTNNNTLNLMQNKIYMMKPIEFLNTFYKNNPSLKEVVDYIKKADYNEHELNTLKEACQLDNKMVIAKEIDNLMKKKNKELINDIDFTCDNVVFSNDGSNRKYIAKGSEQWQYFSNDDLIDKSTSLILEQATKTIKAKYAKKDRMVINNNIKKLNDFNNNKNDLCKQLDYELDINDEMINNSIINNVHAIKENVEININMNMNMNETEYIEEESELSDEAYEASEASITYEVNTPIYDDTCTYNTLEDCGKKHYYDEHNNNVFSLNKKYEGIRVHDDDCECLGECWYYIKYHNEI